MPNASPLAAPDSRRVPSPAVPSAAIPAQRRGPAPAGAAVPAGHDAPGPAPAAKADRAVWRALRHRHMRWWSGVNLVSNVGTWMQLTVQNLLVLHLSGSAALTGLSVALQAAPGLFLGLAGGAAVDRWPRKVTAAAGQGALAVLAFTTAALVALGLLTVPVLLLLAVLTGLVATVEGPACALFGNDLVPREDVPSAIAVGSVVSSVGRLAGVAVTGVAVSQFGTASAYVANGFSFLLVATVIPFLRPLAGQRDQDPDQGPEQDRGAAPHAPSQRFTAWDGIRFFCGRRRLLALAGISALSCVLGRNYGLTLAALVTGPLHGGAGAYGTVSTVLAVGGTVGAVLAGRLRRPSVRLVALLVAAGAVLQSVAACSPTVLLLAVVVAPMALLEALGDTAVLTILQTDPPAHLRGRVLGAWRSLSTVWTLAGPPAFGLFIQLSGARTALLVGGLLVGLPLGAAALRRGQGARRAAPVVQPT
ncbi:MFS transporter [Kitasatospora sp. NPDC018619]|uniref:MFS transporter n=1 Tax=unclassified Kitasatospora TaxID=2633591 RepID=UPI0037A065B1